MATTRRREPSTHGRCRPIRTPGAVDLGRDPALQRGGEHVRELYGGPSPLSTSAGRTFELIFVDDGSTDATFAELERIHAADGRVRAVRFKRNFGQHSAMHAGLVRARGEILVTMDGDLQNAPEDLPRLVEAVESGTDVASGTRDGEAGLLGADAAFARDQRNAPPLHARRHLGLRLRVQRVPAQRDRADARRDRAGRSSRRRSCSRAGRASSR